jgi:rod shape-determining protein MreD
MHHALSGRVVFYLFFLLIIDLCVSPLVAAGSVRPVLLYLMMIYAAFEWHWERTFSLAFFVGILRDMTGSHPFGIETAVLVLTSIALDFVIRTIERKSWLMRSVVTLLYVLAVSVGVLLLSALLGYRQYWTWQSLLLCFQTALYTSLIMPFFFYFTSRWFTRRHIVRQYELFD